MDLSGSAGDFRWDFFSGYKRLRVAERHRWRPAGTVPAGDEFRHRPGGVRSRGYASNDVQGGHPCGLFGVPVMTHLLRIALAEDEPDTRAFLERTLAGLGHAVAAVADGRHLVELCRAAPPDLVVADVRLPGLGGLEAAAAVNRLRPTPAVLVTGHDDPSVLGLAAEGPVMALLTRPVRRQDLAAAVTLAAVRFAQYRLAFAEANALRGALEERKAVERARGVLMRRLGVGEEDAYGRLRRHASAHNRKMAEVAQEVLAAEQVYRDLEGGPAPAAPVLRTFPR